MDTTCPECGDKYERIGTHWRYNPSHRPSLSNYQEDVITGLLMGDGHVNRSDSNPRIRVSSIEKQYLEYLDKNIFESVGQGVSLSKTAEELAERNRSSDMFKTVNEDQYNDVYWWESCAHPDLSQFSEWYSGGSKTFPSEIDLSPVVLSHWYVGDGTLDDRWNPRVLIAASNESDNKEKLCTYFSKAGLPEPHFSETERSSGGVRMSMMWDSKDSMEILEYMNGPIVGFEYKWPDRYK